MVSRSVKISPELSGGNMFRKFTLLFALLLAAFTYTFASAHEVEVLKSDPADGVSLEASPAQVAVWFSEELQTKVSTLRVFNQNGQQVDSQDGGVDLDDPDHASMRVSLPALTDGVYIVRWHVVLTDGDASDGEFSFAVGDGAIPYPVAVSAVSAPITIDPYPTPEEAAASTSSLVSSSSTPWIALGGLVLVVFIAGVLIFLRTH
jgi:methionine-rich copper-binding protein CopC